MGLLEETLAAILPPDEIAAAEAGRRLDSLTKPRGSLGYLEEIVRRYTAIRRDPEARIGGGALCVFVADHGVAEEGVSAYPQAVTAEMLRNIAGVMDAAEFVGVFKYGGMPLEEAERNMKLFAAEVLPHIQRGTSPIVQSAAAGR